jgi:hypothetical protein
LAGKNHCQGSSLAALGYFFSRESKRKGQQSLIADPFRGAILPIQVGLAVPAQAQGAEGRFGLFSLYRHGRLQPNDRS